MYIQDIPKNSKFWVVRSGDGGMFYDHFVHNSIAAIGHIDAMEFSNQTLSNKEEVIKLVHNYKNTLLEKKETLASASNKAGQVLRFINEMSVGDIIITLDAKRIIVGKITSNPYKDIESVTLLNVDGITDEKLLKFSLRRNVEWGKTQFRDKLPLAINNSFRANQTVFSANEYWKELNHWLSVAFISDNEAYISSRIEQTEGINNLDIAQYSIIINKIEAIAQTIADNDNLDFDNKELLALFENTYKELRKNRTFTVTTQQVFLSPGDLWAKTSGSRKKSLLVVCTFLIMFNIEPSFADDKDKIFFDNNYESISLLINKVKNDENFEEVKSGLALKVPTQKLNKKYKPANPQKKCYDDDVEPDDFEGI
ncbi:hypothetical protein ACQU0Y_004089 [Salmonella enterica subsp. enterica serovar Reading]|uniref:Uncharacterized protein n=2 Tax=Salmonella enterica TaxID=28901 RepID=A0A379QGJ0_SALER|nr:MULTISPECIES: hypothetical protein [Salmonella]MCL8955383.1 hypothetical protein [Salmonella enterica subsp. enterica serovar Enteritidis]MDJ4404307.1 hypothetical protein [Salmonella enterica]UOH25745.1 hypothetical protein EKH94_05360 [Salmonella enterica]UOH95076.1 hypothetical protein DI251_05360 [Salmonella enterica subsp. enterica serovar Reading]UOI51341.1 hypothetical protein CDI94_05345 [Salmonella enterica subsp. enterica serovar Reading]